MPINRGTGPPAVNILSSYVLPGVDWDYYQAFYRHLGLARDWPEGMSAHASWEGSDGWRTIYLWDDNLTADQYFGSVGLEAVTDTVRELGPAKSASGTTDVEPLRLQVHEWLLGYYAGAFSDISEDPDGTAIDKLGTRPVIVELDLTAEATAVISALGVEKRIPRDLIALLVADHPIGSRMLQIWADDEIARAALETVVFPALQKIGIECDPNPAESIFELRRLVVADGAAESFGHPPAIEL
ncbi:MAG: hypothetical protein JHC98_09955 [Thermoleophilaceae bacterium]|nr:hypothetical protein [Thermoleophilaceae bacterium]